jgi:hypothetical protein
MGYIGNASGREGRVAEFTIGASDIDAAAQGVSLTGTGGVITGFRVLAGTGALRYLDRKGNAQQLGNVTALAAGDEITPEHGIVITRILGTSNATPSAALTLRAVWS